MRDAVMFALHTEDVGCELVVVVVVFDDE